MTYATIIKNVERMKAEFAEEGDISLDDRKLHMAIMQCWLDVASSHDTAEHSHDHLVVSFAYDEIVPLLTDEITGVGPDSKVELLRFLSCIPGFDVDAGLTNQPTVFKSQYRQRALRAIQIHTEVSGSLIE